MKCSQLVAGQTLRAGIDEVFDFFSDARNLSSVTPSWLHFRILTPDVEMRVGATIDYRIRLGWIPLRWTSEITAWEPGRRFVDEQRRGPYRVWIHEHRFTSLGNDTRVEDLVRYVAPGGRVVESCFVRPQLASIFRYRQQVLGERFGRVGRDALTITGPDHDSRREDRRRGGRRATGAGLDPGRATGGRR